MLSAFFGRNRDQAPSGALVPQDTRVYAVGDVHGCAERLEALHQLIAADAAAAGAERKVVVYVGDYVDRGPDSKAVVELLLSDPLPGFDIVHLIGNHEDFLRRFREDGSIALTWFMNGGDATLRSYGVDPYEGSKSLHWLQDLQHAFHQRLPPDHAAFFDGLAVSHVEGDYLFVHAGVRPGLALDRQDPEDLIWIREPFLSSGADHGKIVVHGHTPATAPELRANRINVDTGACFGGPLTALVLHEDQQAFLQA
jgi:serine/threonine protein phosphatase 1